jgi:NAD(P)-dependent dehydrogenase (short-subunit alcohol dehydrogenase family)
MEQKRNEQRAVARRRGNLLAGLRAALGLDWLRFRDKVVIVTGGSRGLGLILARRLALLGARVAILARDEGALLRALEDLRRRGGTVIAVRCDVRDRAQVQSAVRTVVQELGPVDVLINNAGILQAGPMETMTLEDYEDNIRTHVLGPLHMSLAVLPEMRRRGSGRIVNISSVGGQVAPPHLLPYVASKFALTGLSEGMRAELQKEGIVVTTVNPGLMRTGSVYNAFFKGQHRAELTWFATAASLPFLSISAERAASMILFAVRRGRSQVTLGALAKLAARLHGLLPGLTSDLFGLANRLLPEAGGIGTRRARGRDSQTRLTSSFLTALTQAAARRYNQIAAPGQPDVNEPLPASQTPAGQPIQPGAPTREQ